LLQAVPGPRAIARGIQRLDSSELHGALHGDRHDALVGFPASSNVDAGECRLAPRTGEPRHDDPIERVDEVLGQFGNLDQRLATFGRRIG
jgi:hypothetical protein